MSWAIYKSTGKINGRGVSDTSNSTQSGILMQLFDSCLVLWENIEDSLIFKTNIFVVAKLVLYRVSHET